VETTKKIGRITKAKKRKGAYEGAGKRPEEGKGKRLAKDRKEEVGALSIEWIIFLRRRWRG